MGPPNLSRRSTPQYISKSKGLRSGEPYREREREDEDGEMFLQYCTYCEKQIDSSSSHNFLYCSESCRQLDLSSHYQSHSPTCSPPTSPSYARGTPTAYPSSLSTYDPMTDGPDIVPRASPTIFRPRSCFNSDPCLLSMTSTSGSLPQSQHQYPYQSAKHSTSALASLRELSANLDTTRSRSNVSKYDRNNSRHSNDERDGDSAPTSLKLNRSGSVVWNYMPFSSAATSFTPRQIARSYRQPQVSSNCGAGHGATGYNYSNGLSRTPETGTDRPLPPLRGGYGHRPRSMDLVTPFSGAI